MLEVSDLWADSQSKERHGSTDVMVMPHLAFSRILTDGTRAIRTECVSLDFAVINALGSNHWAETAIQGDLANERDDETKRRRSQAEARGARSEILLSGQWSSSSRTAPVDERTQISEASRRH